MDLRYLGQAYGLNLGWQGLEATAEAFHRLHRERYGHRLDLPVELVNLRVRVTAAPPSLVLAPTVRSASDHLGRRLPVAGCEDPVPVLKREALVGADSFPGAAVILDAVSTTWLERGWTARLDAVGNMHLERR